MTGIAGGLLLYVVFLFSTSLHEAAHAWAALKGGDPTAFEGGQVTLDPLPHIRRDPIGMVVLPLLTVVTIGWPLGYASAPYDPRWAEQHPDRAGLMALAGPGANLLLAVCSGLLINAGLFAGVFEAPEMVGFMDVTTAAAGNGSLWQVAAYLLGAVFALNLLLAVFNLLPLPPLDGSGALVLLMPEKLAPKYQTLLHSNPFLGLMGILIAWQVFDFFFEPVFTGSLNLLYWLHGASYSF
jgi:Zn-dependent protease